MKKWFVYLCMILAFTACQEEKKENADTRLVVKIGATLPLTGNLAYIGEGSKNALEMVMEKWQKADTTYQYQIAYENDMLKIQQAVLNTHRFIDMNKVNVIVSVFGMVDRPVDDITNQNKVISLSCSYGKEKLPEYGFNTSPQNEEIYASALRELQKRNVKTVGLLGSDAAVSHVLLDYMAEHLPQDKIKVLSNEIYPMDEKDYRLSIHKMEQNAPDYYLIFGVEPMNSIFIRQYHEITGKNNLLSLGSFANISLKVFPPINGLLSVYMIGNNEAFEKEYFEKYQSRVEACSANLYDGLDMIIKAFENTPVREGKDIPDNADVLQTLKNFKTWNGAFGKMEINQNGTVKTDVEVRAYHDGKWIKTEEEKLP